MSMAIDSRSMIDGRTRAVSVSRPRRIEPTNRAVGGHLLSAGSEPRPLVVAVHGIARQARETLDRFAPEAKVRGYDLFAPDFDAERFDDYQRLGRRGRGDRADLALLEAIDGGRVGAGPDRADTPFFLVGYSAGAQFVHRFAMAHPERVLGVAVVSAGWYTLPDARHAYPRGLRVDGLLPGVRLEPSRFLAIPTLVAVGAEDTERDADLRTSPRLDRAQGGHRLARARRFTERMKEAAAESAIESRHELIELERAGHSLGACVDAGLPEALFDFFDRAQTQPEAHA